MRTQNPAYYQVFSVFTGLLYLLGMGVSSRKDSLVIMDTRSGSSCSSRTKVVIADPPKKKHISTTYALINMLKGMCGPGCFALPLSFKQAGLWTGFGLVFLLGAISAVCMIKLVRCSQYLCKKNKKTTLDYGQMAEEAFRSSFGPLKKFDFVAKIVVNVNLALLQMGICSVFYIFVVDHLREIIHHLLPAWDANLTRNDYFFIVLPPFLLLSTVRTLKIISYICLLGNALMTVSLTIILQELVRAPHINTRDLKSFTNLNGVTLAAGSILYALLGQAMVLPLENKMKYPHDMKGFTGVLSTGCQLVSLIYAACGFYGYITYGDDVEASITLNLTDAPLDFSVKIMLLIVVYSGFLIQAFPIIEMIWPTVKDYLREKDVKRVPRIAAEYVLRYGIVFLALGLALAIPNLDEIIPLVGISTGMILSLVLPAALETVCLLPVWLEGPRWKLVLNLVLNTFYFVLGIIFVVTGVNANLQNIIHPTSN